MRIITVEVICNCAHFCNISYEWIEFFLMLSDWVEFTPYEIGMAKYGTFMTPDLFGSKFFMGKVVKKYEENPLHFLMGK